MNFAQRRARLAESLGDGVLVLPTNPERTRSNDTQYRYRASSDVLYLTGFPEPDTVVVFRPSHPETPLVLFVRPRDKEREIWDGFRYGPEGAMERFGADAAFPIDQLDAELPKLLKGASALHYSLGIDPAFDARMFGMLRSLGATRRAPDRAPPAIVNPRPALHALRCAKDADELKVMATAAEITAAAHLEAMQTVRPGMYEFEVEAQLEAHFRRKGAVSPAYTSIVAGGANACCLHYVENKDVLRDGDLLLIDAGCEFQNYAADITRTFPVGASFSGEQRAIYELVLAVEEAAIAEARPGRSNDEMQQAATRALTQGLVDLGLLEGDVDALIEDEKQKRFYMHGLGHYLGIDVHDVGAYWVDEGVGAPMPEGAVITIEPGIYVGAEDAEAPERFRGIGVRIEDDVVLTAEGPRVLTGDVPKAIDDIEALRREVLGTTGGA